MTDEVAVQLVKVGTPEIVKLFALKAEHLVTCECARVPAALSDRTR
jgi:hypothetical protein